MSREQIWPLSLSSFPRGIPAYYDHPISTGPLEGTNDKIKTLQRQAYGFRDRTFFILRIYTLHTASHKLSG
ncbi:MAG: transposase [Desulfomonile tiedjei]|nr:transposase [Desulfomonile tiedjei]